MKDLKKLLVSNESLCTHDVKEEFEYFRVLIALESILMPKKYRLQPSQAEFLAYCCTFNYLGGDISDYQSLMKFLQEVGGKRFKKKGAISDYKSKVASKYWIKSSWGELKLPAFLDIKRDETPVLRKVLDLKFTGTPSNLRGENAQEGGENE